MPVESVVKSGIIFTTTDLQKGVTETVEGMRKVAAEATKTSETVKTKSQAMAEAAKNAAATITSADLRIAEAANVARKAKADQAAATKDVLKGYGAENDALVIQAAAMQAARVAALKLAEAQEAVAVASHKAVTDVQATSAAIRTLEGNAGLRAVENFIAKTLGLGPALSGIFPIVGALAFGKIIFDLGEGFVDLVRKALNSGKAIREAFEAINQPLLDAVDHQAVFNSKLQDEIDKLEKHPGDGLRTALLEAREAADKLLVSLNADAKALENLLSKNRVNVFQQAFTGVASTGVQADQIRKDQSQLLEDIRGINEKTAAERARTSDPAEQKAAGQRNAAAIRARFQTEIDKYKIEAGRLVSEQLAADAQVLAGVRGAEPIHNQAKLGNVTGYTTQLQARQSLVTGDAETATLQETVGKLRQEKEASRADKGSETAENKADQAKYRAMELALNQEKLIHSVSVKEEFQYWQDKVSAFREGSNEYLAITAKLAEISTSGSRVSAEKIKRFKAEQDRDANADVGQQQAVAKVIADVNKRQAEDLTQTGERWATYRSEIAKGNEIAARQAEIVAETNLKIREAAGSVSAIGAAQQLAAIHAEEHRRTLAALRAELEAIEKDETLDPAKKATATQGVKNSIATEEGGGANQRVQDQQAVALAIASPYKKGFQVIGKDFQSLTDSMLKGQVRISQGFERMGSNMVLSLIHNIEEMGLRWAQHEIATLAQHQAANTAKVTSDAIAAGASEAISAASTLKQGFHYAVLAAQKAFSAFADIPIVGPELGAVAAGATFAAVLALNTFEKGGVVQGQYGLPQIIQAHAGERVLSTSQTQMFEKVVNGNGGSGGTVNHHYHIEGGNNFSSADGDFKAQFAAHESHIIRMLKVWKRDGKM